MRYRYQSPATLKDRAKGFLDGNYLVCVEAVLIYAAVRLILSTGLVLLDSSLLEMIPAIQSGVGSLIYNAVILVISVVLGAFINMMLAGLSLICLKLASGQVPYVADLLDGYRTNPERTFLISLGISVPQSLVMLPFNLLYSFYLWDRTSVSTVAMGVSGVLGLGLAVFFALSLGLGFFLMYDFPNLSAKETLRETWKRMKGHKTRLLKLELSFIPMMLLALASYFVGFLWVYPYMQETVALFYLDMMNPQPVSDRWERTV